MPTVRPADVDVSIYQLDATSGVIKRGVASIPFPWDKCVTTSVWTSSRPIFGPVTFDFHVPVIAGARYAVLLTGAGVGGDGGTGLELAGDPATSSVGGKILSVQAGTSVGVTGLGFLPGSEVEVWTLPSPHLLATVKVGDDGTFDAPVKIAVASVGSLTIQAEGTANDGTPRAVAIGIEVSGPDSSSGTADAPGVPSSLAFAG